jgi:hypothetical protein
MNKINKSLRFRVAIVTRWLEVKLRLIRVGPIDKGTLKSVPL